MMSSRKSFYLEKNNGRLFSKRNRLTNIKRTISCLLFSVVLCFFFGIIDTDIHAKNINEHKIVRVAYFENENFLEGASETSVKSGYCYEVLHEISNHTGWKYEYVYGEWSELYDEFIKGNIDIFPGLAYREDREEYMNWCEYPIDKEYHSLYVNKNDKSVVANDWATLNGKNIGVIRGSDMTNEFIEWAEKKEITPVFVYYDDENILPLQLDKGIIDGFIGSENYVKDTENSKLLVRIAETESYIAVRKTADDILEELNQALYEINISHPVFFQELTIKYYSNVVTKKEISEAEEEWISEHKVIKIGYVDNYLPFSGKDKKGNVTGVITDIVDQIGFELELAGRIKVEYISFNSYNEMLFALESEEIDVAFPVLKSVWHAEQSNTIQSTELVYSSISAIYEGSFDSSKLETIAVDKNSAVQRIFVSENYPNSKIVGYNSMSECLEAVKKGEVGCTLFNGTRTKQALTGKYELLSEMSLGKTVAYTVAVHKGNTVLHGLINRGINRISVSDINNTMYAYVAKTNAYTVKNFIRDYSWVISLVVVVILLYYVITRAKINKMMDKNASLSIQAFKDQLTKTGNRSAYLAEEDKLNRLMKENKDLEFGIAVIDINCLKQVNDRFGHEMGDVLIKNVSKAVCEVFKKSPVFRIGGDEFVVSLSGEDFKNRNRLSEEFAQRESTSLSLAGVQNGAFSAAWGVAVFDPEKDKCANDVFRRADKNMYRRKEELKHYLVVE